MSASSRKRSAEFLKISGQFKLGTLVTESTHPATANLSDVAGQDIAAALSQLFDVDNDVVKKYREFVASGRAVEIKETVLRSLKNGGRIFFTGCGATGRLSIMLDSIWRDFWQCSSRRKSALTFSNSKTNGLTSAATKSDEVDFENRTFSIMAGGDYALIKSVEGFEDFAAFGRQQLRDLGVRAGDVVFAITEGGETSFVIGTAWEGVDAGAKVYFVYNNPDEILCQQVERSREVIQDARIEKINLTTGPMAITGSTRMQATTIQLCVLFTILEMVVRDLMAGWVECPREPMKIVKTGGSPVVWSHQTLTPDSTAVPAQFLAGLEEMHASLKSPELLAQLARLVALEESVYRTGHKNNYFADRFGIDVLTDTTERSPTYCTPPFRKFDDATATESWAFLFLPQKETPEAWRHILKRQPRCVEWNETGIHPLVGEENFARTLETVRKISSGELMRFKIGLDGLKYRPLGPEDSAVAIVSEQEKESLLLEDGFYRVQLEAARKAGARTGLIYYGSENSISEIRRVVPKLGVPGRDPVEPGKLKAGAQATLAPPCELVFVPIPESGFLLDGVARVAIKLVMNALSTCTMVRLGRVMGNIMVWVVPSNLKLIDRATRYITRLTGLTYEAANGLLFEVIEYVEPRMKSDQAYPPVVGMAVLRARHGLTNEEAEKRL